ncbi:MAG TPA: Nif3-like dinuclear metal center hexameric protein [Bacteroidales bacterium]|nr:Nif3-like dinuclear metal center hexameric protein [Bacteroidales bacterium]
MKIKELLNSFEEFAPLALQEDYDNSGLQIGNYGIEITGILISIDITPAVVEEAIKNKLNLIVSHHPLIFSKLKRINGNDYIEKSIILAIKNDIAIYCGHTNFDNVYRGVSAKICNKLGLSNLNILAPKTDILKKIVVFVPESHAEKLKHVMFDAGAGHIGNYDNCSFNASGTGSFRANDSANPFVGEIGKIHFENEQRIEMIYPAYIEKKLIQEVLKSHPYEEVAYDIYKLDNNWNKAGLGMIGEFKTSINEKKLLSILREKFNVSCIRHSNFLDKPVKKVAVCGGSGAFLISAAKNSDADVFISGDIKYHDYFIADNQILIIDIGHFESEQFTKEIFYDIIMKNNPNFAVRFSEINTNPINTF